MGLVDCEFVGAFLEIDGGLEWVCFLVGGGEDGELVLHALR